MSRFSLSTPEQIATQLAERLRTLRLARNWKQSTLAERSGVSLGSLRRFEASGRTSLRNLLRLAFALGCLDDFGDLLLPPSASSIAELEAQERAPRRSRGRR